MMQDSPSLHLSRSQSTLRAVLKGRWCMENIPSLHRALEGIEGEEGLEIVVKGGDLEALDTGGAYLLMKHTRQWMERGARVTLRDFREDHRRLLDLLTQTPEVRVCTRPVSPNPFYQLGRWAHALARDILAFMAFLGEATLTASSLLLKPSRVPWQEILYEMEEAGSKAIPIVTLVAILAGVVIAYQGALQLKRFGASIFIVDLLAISMAREMAPLLTAIMVAGRSGSAYTAQIGTMKVNEEIDALRTLGISPMETLVIPKVGALIVVLPLLILLADLVGIGGGMVISRQALGITFHDFIFRLQEALPLGSFLIGIAKGPIFALPLGLISCFRGFQVKGSAEEVGRYTTMSVVNTIFAVIAIDAILSVILGNMGL